MSEQIPTAVASSLVWHDRTHAEIRDAALPSLPDGLIYGWMTTAGTIYAGEGYPVPPRSFSLDNVSCAALLIRRATPTPAPDAVAEGLRERIAKIVDPMAFKHLEALYEYCIACGDNEADARKVADDTHKHDCDKALAKADAILAALPASQPDKLARDYTKQRIGELIEEGDGDWVACSGCQESVDGCVSTKDYPYNPVFRCQPGGGCSECGGIGVLWRDRSYYAMWEQKIPASQPVADVETRKRDMPGDPDGLGTIALQWYVSFNFAHPHTVRESNVAVEAFKDGYRAASATLTARVERLEGALGPFANAAKRLRHYRNINETYHGSFHHLYASRNGRHLLELFNGIDGEPLTILHVVDAEAILSPDPAVKPEWCSRCGCGNDACGYAHLASCPTQADDEGPCTTCGDTGVTYQTERTCSCGGGDPAVKPSAEGGDL